MSAPVIVSDAAGQREWIKAFLPFALRKKYPTRVMAVVMALFELHFNRRSGQCDPGYPLLAKELGVSRSTIERAMLTLKRDGWVRVRPAGHDNIQITFVILRSEVTPVVPSAANQTPQHADGSRSKQTQQHSDGSGNVQTRHRKRSDPADIAVRPVTQGDGTNEHRTQNTRERAPARAPVFADRESVTAPPLAPADAAAAAPPRTPPSPTWYEEQKKRFGKDWGLGERKIVTGQAPSPDRIAAIYTNTNAAQRLTAPFMTRTSSG